MVSLVILKYFYSSVWNGFTRHFETASTANGQYQECSNPRFGTDVAAVLDQPIASIATKSVITINVNDDLGHISSVLADKHLKKAPVVADDGTVVGIINRSDINRYLVSTFIAPAG